MEGFFARHRNATVLTLVLSLQFVLLGYQVRTNQDVRLLRVWAVTVILPVQNVIDATTDFFRSSWTDYVWLRDARRENEQLREQLDRLKLEQQQLRRALARFERADDFLAYQNQITSETVLAEVIAVGANPNAREIFVDKGSRAGIKPGMAVITPDGIVGKVQSVHGRASLVLLVNDPDGAAGVILTGSGVHGVMKGTGKGECRVDYVSHEVEVKIGEKLYTSGDDRIFPKGLPVGEVTRLEEGTEYQQLYAKPYARLDRLDEVLIVTHGMHEDIPELFRPQAPEVLMPVPAASPDPLSSATAPVSGQEAGEIPDAEAAPTVSGGEPLSGPLTDADRLKQRYQSVGAAQGHVFGEGLPGSRPPDFNMGWLPAEEENPQGPKPKGSASPPDSRSAPASAPAPTVTGAAPPPSTAESSEENVTAPPSAARQSEPSPTSPAPDSGR